MKLKQLLIGFFALISVLAVCLPLFHPTFFRVHDYVHATRIIEVVRALQDGHFPVRWSENLGYGYGMPLFEFYAPLPFYLGALFFFLGFPVVASIKLLFFLSSLLAFFGMFFAGEKLFGKAGGLLSAVAYTLAPYRAVNLYVRGALSESWGITALPWVLLGIILVIDKKKNGWWVLLFGLLILLLSHNITTLLFVPISILFAVGYWGIRNFQTLQFKSLKKIFISVSPLLLTASAFLFAVGLAAFYIFPAFLEKDFTQINQIFSGYFSYANHFVYIRQFFTPNWGYGGSVWGPDDGISFFLGYGQLVGAGLAGIFCLNTLFFIVFKLLQKKEWQLSKTQMTNVALGSVFFILLIFSCFMSLLKSKFIWDALKFMVAVQFPWRWLSVIIVFVALLAGLSAAMIQHKFIRYIYVFLLSSVILFGNVHFFQPDKYLTDDNQFYYTDKATIRKQMSQILPDYIPLQMAKELQPVPVGTVILNQTDEFQTTIVSDEIQKKVLTINSPTSRKIELSIADFPGWTVVIDGKEVPKNGGKVGNIQFDLPEGTHEVIVELRDTPIRKNSDIVSASCGILVLAILSFTFMKQFGNRHYERQ